MIAAVVTLGLALLGATGAIVLLVRALLGGLESERASFAAEVNATRERLAAEAQRDDALDAVKRKTAEADEARKHLDVVMKALTNARKELTRRVEQEILHADPGDAARLVDDLLSQPILPAVDGAHAAASDDFDEADTPALRPAPAAAGGDPGRSPGT